MSYEVVAGAIVELTLVARMYNQKVMLVRHYVRDPAETDPLTDAGGALDQIAATWDDPTSGITHLYSTYATTDMHFETIRAQWIYPTRYAYRTYEANVAIGAQTPPTLPQNVTLPITMQSDLGGRHGRGNVFLTGWEINTVIDGSISAMAKGHMDLIGNWLNTNISFNTGGNLIYPIIYRKALPSGSHLITHWKTQDTSRTFRRRTVGHGI